jgi:hypothetical protein
MRTLLADSDVRRRTPAPPANSGKSFLEIIIFQGEKKKDGKYFSLLPVAVSQPEEQGKAQKTAASGLLT